jgi:hypothetical protein
MYERTFDGDDQLGNNGQDFIATLVEEIMNALSCQESEGLINLTETGEEKGQVVVVIQLFNIDLSTSINSAEPWWE